MEPRTRAEWAPISPASAGAGRCGDRIGRGQLRARGLLEHTNIIVTSTMASRLTGTPPAGARRAIRRKLVTDRAISSWPKAPSTCAGRSSRRASPRSSLPCSGVGGGRDLHRQQGKGLAAGELPGTLSFDVARWNHARSGQILVSANWTSERNKAGLPGTTTQGGWRPAPRAVRHSNTLVAAGPIFANA
jgi:hypothetical protein